MTGDPIADAVCKGADGKVLAKTGPSGAFCFQRASKAAWFIAEKPGYAPSGKQRLDGPAPGHPMTVQVRKTVFSFGDIVDVIRYDNPSVLTLGFRDGRLTLLGNDDSTHHSVLMPVDPTTKRLLAPGERLPVNQLTSFTECAGRTLFFKTWSNTQVYELASTNLQPLFRLTHPADRSPLVWPFGAAFDGSLLSFVENDSSSERFGVHALDLEQGKIVHSLRSSDKSLKGLAWDGTKFWLGSNGRVYQVNREMALGHMTVEAGIGREFAGTYTSLAFASGHLWGLDRERSRLCKFKISD
jgi:hypothetical protein